MSENIKEIKKNKFKIGVLGCGFACHEDLDKRLNPWFNSVHHKDFVFSFVSARFKEYEELNINQDNSETEKAFKFLLDSKLIQYLNVPNQSMSEAEARNLALKPLLEAGCDYILLLDISDEYYSEEQIHNILFFLNQEDNEFSTWFSIPFKNYIFDGKQWIDGFCPPRIFKVNAHPYYSLTNFYWDNDIQYKIGTSTLISYKECASKSIPKNLLCGGVRHMTWLHTNGKDKVSYQMKHFNGICSYRFNEEKQELEFNPEFYKNQPYPQINNDE